jgi:hypothetical protein
VNVRPYRFSPAMKDEVENRFKKCSRRVLFSTVRVHSLHLFYLSRKRTNRDVSALIIVI